MEAADAHRAGRPPAPEEVGWLHCGPNGAGHFVKMVHNGIEYALMAAFAEGLNVLHHADAGTASRDTDAETAPFRNPSLPLRHRRREGHGALAARQRRVVLAARPDRAALQESPASTNSADGSATRARAAGR